MSEVERALVADLRADLDDWRQWLVFADWLTEHGDPRGELIEIEHQLAVARRSQEENRPLRARARALEATHRREWLQGWKGPKGDDLWWRGGFVVGVTLRWSEQTLADLEGPLAHPLGRLLTALDLSNTHLDARGAAVLAASQTLRALTRLDLTNNELGADGASALASSPNLRNLTKLQLWGNALGIDGATALAASPNLGALRWLDLGGNAIGDEGAAALADSEGLSTLTRLHLTANAIGDEGASALASTRTLRSLTELRLSYNAIGDEGARALAAARTLDTLTELCLGHNAIGDEGAAALAASDSLRNLATLNLAHNAIGDRGAANLAASERLRSLTELHLGGNALGDESAATASTSRRGDRRRSSPERADTDRSAAPPPSPPPAPNARRSTEGEPSVRWRVRHPAFGVPSPSIEALRSATVPDARPLWDAALTIAGWRQQQHAWVVEALGALQDAPLSRPAHPAPPAPVHGVGPDDMAAALLALRPEQFELLRGPALDQAREQWRARALRGPVPELPLAYAWGRRWAWLRSGPDADLDIDTLMRSLPFTTQGALRTLDPQYVEGLIALHESRWVDDLARRGLMSPRISPAHLSRPLDLRCAAMLDEPPGFFLVGPPGSGKRTLIRQMKSLRPELGINVDNGWGGGPGPSWKRYRAAPLSVPIAVQPGLVCVWTRVWRRSAEPELTRYAAEMALDPTARFRLVLAATAEERAAWIADAPDLGRWPVLEVEPPADDELLALWLCQRPRIEDEIGERVDLWQLLARLDPDGIRTALSHIGLEARWAASDADFERVVATLGTRRNPFFDSPFGQRQRLRGPDAAHRWLMRKPWLAPLIPTAAHLEDLMALDDALSGEPPPIGGP